MTITDIAGGIAGLLALAAYVPYIIAILRRQAKPSLASWFIWAIMDVLIVGSYFSAGARSTLWVPISFMIGAVTVTTLLLKYGEKSWSRLETICSICAGTSIAMWIAIKSPLPTLLLNIAIVSLGAIPTIQKAYRDPSGESRLAWTLFGAASVANLFAVEKWEFAIWIFPVSVFLIEGTMSALVLWPRKKLAAHD